MFNSILFFLSVVSVVVFACMSFKKKYRSRNLVYLASSILAVYLFWLIGASITSFAGYAFWFFGAAASTLFLLSQLEIIKFKKNIVFYN